MFGLKHPYLIGLLIILIGSLFILFSQEKRDDCEMYIEAFRQVNQKDLNLVTKAFKNCKDGNNKGACLHFIEIMRRIILKIYEFEEKCLHRLREEALVKATFTEFFKLWALIAWDDIPPNRGEFCHRSCWFEKEDFSLYCHAKKAYQYLYGKEDFRKLAKMVIALFPSEEPKFEQGECLNCDQRVKAITSLGEKEVFERSLFNLACEAF